MVQLPLVFGGRLEESSPYAVLGVPLEHGPTFREGARWGPLEVRKASNYIEFKCELSGMDADLLGFYDLGDVPVVNDVERSLELIEAELRSTRKVPLIIGGEHTLTYAALKTLEPDCLVVFDAHLDARQEYAGDPWSHASWLRRALEDLRLSKVAVVGARAYVEEEAEFLGSRGVLFAKDMRGFLKRYLGGCSSIYISLDMDYFDPSVVPGVSNPEPGGATFSDFLEHVKEIRHLPLVGADVVELSPPYDPTGTSATYATRALLELATSLRPLSRSPLNPYR